MSSLTAPSVGTPVIVINPPGAAQRLWIGVCVTRVDPCGRRFHVGDQRCPGDDRVFGLDGLEIRAPHWRGPGRVRLDVENVMAELGSDDLRACVGDLLLRLGTRSSLVFSDPDPLTLLRAARDCMAAATMAYEIAERARDALERERAAGSDR